MTSEFGAGLVVCLAKFAEHLDRFSEYRKAEDYSHALELWANGASDHFYDLDRDLAPTRLGLLADLTLEIGHGFTGKKWTEDDWKRILTLYRKSCIELDEMLGTSPDWGEW